MNVATGRPITSHLKKAGLVLILLSFSASFANGQVTREFCVTGTSDAIDFTWTVVFPGTAVGEGGLSVPMGGTASDFVTTFVDSINAQGDTFGISASISPGCSGTYFSITATEDFTFSVSEPGGGLCEVTTAGCEFNGFVQEATCNIVPTLSEWGLIIMVLGFIGIGILRLRG